MFYETKGNRHGLPHDPFKSCIVPRPIGWISTISRDGVVNLAPYSFFNGVASNPPMVMFASGGRQPHGPKDTITNCEETGEFVVNIATWDLRDSVNRSSAPARPEMDEMTLSGLEAEPSRLVKPPRVKASPIHLECRHHRTIDLPSNDPNGRNAIVVGHVLGVHIKDDILTDGRVDMSKFRPIARLGYMDYTMVDAVFTMERPTEAPWPGTAGPKSA